MRQIRKDFYFYSKLANVINEFLIPFVLIGIIVMIFCGVSISVKAYTGIFVATIIVELATVGAYGVLFINKLKKLYPTANDFVDYAICEIESLLNKNSYSKTCVLDVVED